MATDFDLTQLGPADHPPVGEPAPGFQRPLVDEESWADVALSELVTEGPVVLVFFPMDGAFPATYMWTELRDRAWTTFSAAVVGVSVSSPYEHSTFIDRYELPYRLFSDPSNSVAESYGVVHDLDGMAGVAEPRPAVFLIDDEQTVQYAWAATEWPSFPPYDEIEGAIGEL